MLSDVGQRAIRPMYDNNLADYVRSRKGHDRPFNCEVLSGSFRFLSGFDFFNEGCGIDDLDAVKVLDIPQVGIARDDVVGLFLQGAGQKFVVGGIVNDLVGVIDVL